VGLAGLDRLARAFGGASHILAEIEREADSYRMRFLPVTSADEGAERVIEHA
jgi:hypothetical protein